MNNLDDLLVAYKKQIELPWENDIPYVKRVWILWYDKNLQRKFTRNFHEFETLTRNAGHGWRSYSISNWFGNWIVRNQFFDSLIKQPEELRGLKLDIKQALVEILILQLEKCNSNDVFAIDGCGSLYGIINVTELITDIEKFIQGRLLIGFPGKYQSGSYQLLDEHDGTNYHAIPIPNENSI